MEFEAQGEAVRNISLPIHQAKGWMKLVGLVSILQGVLMVISTFGLAIIFAWLPIWAGVLLMQAASAVERSYATGDEAELILSLNKMKTYFVITGVIAIISILVGMMFIFFFGIMGAMLGGMSEYGGF